MLVYLLSSPAPIFLLHLENRRFFQNDIEITPSLPPYGSRLNFNPPSRGEINSSRRELEAVSRLEPVRKMFACLLNVVNVNLASLITPTTTTTTTITSVEIYFLKTIANK